MTSVVSGRRDPSKPCRRPRSSSANSMNENRSKPEGSAPNCVARARTPVVAKTFEPSDHLVGRQRRAGAAGPRQYPEQPKRAHRERQLAARRFLHRRPSAGGSPDGRTAAAPVRARRSPRRGYGTPTRRRGLRRSERCPGRGRQPPAVWAARPTEGTHDADIEFQDQVVAGTGMFSHNSLPGRPSSGCPAHRRDAAVAEVIRLVAFLAEGEGQEPVQAAGSCRDLKSNRDRIQVFPGMVRQ